MKGRNEKAEIMVMGLQGDGQQNPGWSAAPLLFLL